jgi:UDP-N-acetylmuramoylalanine-D-glutamate ligase
MSRPIWPGLRSGRTRQSLEPAAALAVADYFGVARDRIRKAVASYRGLPHRLELVVRRKGVGWYDDSKATTPISSIAALEAFDCPEIIIAGGYDKHIPFDEFGKVIAAKAKAAILIGQTADKIAAVIEAGRTPCPPQESLGVKPRFRSFPTPMSCKIRRAWPPPACWPGWT